MFSLTVRSHLMIAHSLPDPAFGPAQALHGATLVVEATFRRVGLGAQSVVLDIGRAQDMLAVVLQDLTYRNLDEHPAFSGILTTTEVLCRYVAEQLAAQVHDPAGGVEGLTGLEVLLREHPDAWASYTLDLTHPDSP